MSESVLHHTRRPEPTAADAAYMLAVKEAVGPKKEGVVLSLSKEVGSGYVKDVQTGRVFALIRKLVPNFFDSLHAGDTVTFRDNGRKAVAELYVR